jgi:hypothetical protein
MIVQLYSVTGHLTKCNSFHFKTSATYASYSTYSPWWWLSLAKHVAGTVSWQLFLPDTMYTVKSPFNIHQNNEISVHFFPWSHEFTTYTYVNIKTRSWGRTGWLHSCGLWCYCWDHREQQNGNLNRNGDSDSDVTSEDEEEDNNSYDGNVITVMEASNMAQHLRHCRVINTDVLEGIVESTERLHEFNEKSLLNWLYRKRYPLSYKVCVLILFSTFGSTLCHLC